MSATASKLFECVWTFCGVGAYWVKGLDLHLELRRLSISEIDLENEVLKVNTQIKWMSFKKKIRKFVPAEAKTDTIYEILKNLWSFCNLYEKGLIQKCYGKLPLNLWNKGSFPNLACNIKQIETNCLASISSEGISPLWVFFTVEMVPNRAKYHIYYDGLGMTRLIVQYSLTVEVVLALIFYFIPNEPQTPRQKVFRRNYSFTYVFLKFSMTHNVNPKKWQDNAFS